MWLSSSLALGPGMAVGAIAVEQMTTLQTMSHCHLTVCGMIWDSGWLYPYMSPLLAAQSGFLERKDKLTLTGCSGRL